uniref:Uncharacterized protein n=1 Tax=Arundo donax TaxID=35708 RepID=A0A0A9AEM5_ARUDO
MQIQWNVHAQQWKDILGACLLPVLHIQKKECSSQNPSKADLSFQIISIVVLYIFTI